MKALVIHWRNLLALTLCLGLGAGCTKASKARRLMSDADRDFKAQKYDTAEIEYQSALRFSPRNPAAIRQLGLIYYEEGRFPRAFQVLQLANQLDPKNTEVQLKLAEIYANGKKIKEAADLLGKVLQSEPANEKALLIKVDISGTNELANLRQHLETQMREGGQGEAACLSTLGWIDLRQQKTNDAQTEFQKALTLDPKMASIYLGQATLCMMGKDTNGLAQALKTAAELSPVRSATRLKYVDYQLQTGAAAAAKEMLLEITRTAPDYIPAQIYLAKIYLGEHKFDDCKATLGNILTRDSLNYEAMLLSGTLALAQRDASQALAVFKRMEQAYQRSPEVKYYLAMAHYLTNEKQKAISALNEALLLDRSYTPAVRLLADLDFRSGNLTDSVSLLSQLMKDHPENGQAGLALAESYRAQKQPSRALEVLRGMAQMFPNNPEIPRRMAVVFENQGDLAQARAAFEKSLDLDPNYVPALQQIIGLDIHEKRYAEAHHRLDAIMEKNPKAAEPLLLQGDVYQRDGHTNQAESAYAKAIELNPDSPAPYLSLSLLYHASHQEEKALNRLNTLLDKKPNDVSARMLIGVINESAGQYAQAGDAYQKVLVIDTNSVKAMNNLAYLDSEYLNKADEALTLAEKARQLRPSDPATADTLGWILYKKHEYAQALKMIQESDEKNPGQPEVQLHLGLAYYAMGEEQPARLYLQQALASYADFHGKDLARRRLEILDIDPNKSTPEMVQKLQNLKTEDPLDSVVLSRLASIQEQRGEAPQAVESLENLLKINPQDWPAMTRLSRLYADRLNNLKRALDLAKSAHTLAPEDGDVSALLGELAYRTEDYPWALSLLEPISGQSSNQPSFFYHLALAFYAVGRVTNADAAMQKAVQAGVSQPYLDQAQQFLDLRAAVKDPAQTQASGARARQILEKDPNYVPALMVSARLAESNNAVANAEQICQKVLSIYPLFAPAKRELAILYSHSQSSSDLDKAYKMGQEARTSMPDDLELANTLGVLAYGHKDYDRSLRFLLESAEKSGNDPEPVYYLGMDYYQLKQTDQAKQTLQRALGLRLPDKLAANAQSTLKQLK
jgi:tetratricopeptide (TPR) repeat protein